MTKITNRIKTDKKTASGWCRKLLAWYDENRRELPWRKEQDPYRIWLSEVMLQQTKVETVLPYYSRFLETYPTLQDLAAAGEDHVLKLWEGLGYYSRARNFLAAVREVKHAYAGEVPDAPEEFGRLAGVGEYTSAAVLSIAYQQPLAVVDGNVKRVLCRIFTITDDPQKAQTKKKLQHLAQTLLDQERPGDYNQAVMELGALICVPRTPKCQICPVSEYCQAYEQGIAADLPLKAKKKAMPQKTYTAIVVSQNDKFLVRRREEKLLHGLWELPNVPTSPVAEEELGRMLGGSICFTGEPQHLTHEFSHLRWEVSVYHAKAAGVLLPKGEGWAWVTGEEMSQLAFPVVYHPVVQKLTANSFSP